MIKNKIKIHLHPLHLLLPSLSKLQIINNSYYKKILILHVQLDTILFQDICEINSQHGQKTSLAVSIFLLRPGVVISCCRHLLFAADLFICTPRACYSTHGAPSAPCSV